MRKLHKEKMKRTEKEKEDKEEFPVVVFPECSRKSTQTQWRHHRIPLNVVKIVLWNTSLAGVLLLVLSGLKSLQIMTLSGNRFTYCYDIHRSVGMKSAMCEWAAALSLDCYWCNQSLWMLISGVLCWSVKVSRVAEMVVVGDGLNWLGSPSSNLAVFMDAAGLLLYVMLSHCFGDLSYDPAVVLFEENAGVRKVILNRPKKLNILNYEMVCQMLKKLEAYENDPTVKLVILKGNGKAFCAGGDVTAVITFITTGHWSFGASFYRKQLALDYLLGTYKKPLVSLINGFVMGGGAGISMHATFRIVTEKTVFAMPETSIGLFPDVGASHFLSRLPGFFGEYLGLTGARLDGIEMLTCGLATHFVNSKDLDSLEIALNAAGYSDTLDIMTISKIINKFVQKGSRAMFFDKDKRPQWKPSKLEQVSEEMVNQCSNNIDDDDWVKLQIPTRSMPTFTVQSKI
ncbi:hypothetical protein TEA_027039 [Camellia sinensis var. sinensis]|uniref:3-hydroxyisobutyryl-CoA hydrolase n=1 Tax=Camellia sinensis var. sinensis TaxID=542762 RepID=A0A4S4E6P0_CAMSN|nr:hypothetical protein TEA_027039 [Camellia sinensis var. sinensis]